MKTCNKCKVTKDLSEFYTMKRFRKSGVKYDPFPSCKPCAIKAATDYKSLTRAESKVAVTDKGTLPIGVN